MKNKILIFITWIFLVFGFADCNKPEVTVYNKKELKNIKIIKFNKIEINSLNFDPFIKDDVINIIEFKLNKAGYRIIKNVSTNKLINYDAVMNFYLSHRKFFKGINDIENITIDLKLYDKTENKICEVFFTDSAEEDILNTVKLKKYISEIIKQIKNIK